MSDNARTVVIQPAVRIPRTARTVVIQPAKKVTVMVTEVIRQPARKVTLTRVDEPVKQVRLRVTRVDEQEGGA